MEHRIRLILVGHGQVAADPNPQRRVAPGDTVIWAIEASGTRNPAAPDPRIVFKERQELPVDGSDAVPCSPDGPFSALMRSAGEISGTVVPESQGRFIYNVLEGDTVLEWLNGLEGQNFGGIDLPKPPPDRQ